MRHGKNWMHWCPKGCGKRVVYHPMGCLHLYKCQKCMTLFTKEELNKIQTMSHLSERELEKLKKK